MRVNRWGVNTAKDNKKKESAKVKIRFKKIKELIQSIRRILKNFKKQCLTKTNATFQRI